MHEAAPVLQEFPLLFLVPLRSHLRQHFTKMTLAGDKLRYESGVLSKTTRTIPVSKIQDVRARQSFGQRLIGVGDLTVETAGEATTGSPTSTDQSLRPLAAASASRRRPRTARTPYPQ